MAFLHSSKFDPSPKHTISSSLKHQQQYQLDDWYIDRLDNTEVLGGEDGSGQYIGHTGCVNALSWSPSGQLLASGSDDRNVVLWKLGSEDTHPVTDPTRSSRTRSSIASGIGTGAFRRTARDAQRGSQTQPSAIPDGGDEEDHNEIVQEWPQRSFPKMGLGMLGKIETGHRANIFSVKWAPNASERRLFTCAGDSHVRVFDINYMGRAPGAGGADSDESRMLPSGRSYDTWSESSGACIRLFRCHRGRAKRISTEVSPDVFLTCGEDGDVRQMDLRVPHTCSSRTNGSCPPPLARYPTVLYSLSVSKLEPWLFAVAGETSLAYLHDRRMITRVVKRDWGMTTDVQQDALTMCVRSFGIPPGGFEAPWVHNDGRTALVNEAPHSTSRRLLMGNRNSITACKLSEHNGRDLLLSYSSGHIYRFDIYDEPGVLHANLDKVRFSLDDEGSLSPAAERTAADDPRRPAVDKEEDLEMGEAQSRRDTHAYAQDENAVAGEDDGEEADAVGVELEAESIDSGDNSNNDSDDDDNNNNNNNNNNNDNEDDDDEDLDQDDDDDGDDDDEGDMSEADIMDLLEEDARERSTFAKPVVPTVYPRSAYKGHCNKETVKDVAFAGRSDEYVISGSDDGNWFMWDKLTSEIKGIWHGDSSVVNVMEMHPDLPVFAISGIDDTIKIFAPITVTPFPPATAEEAELDTEGSTGRRRQRAGAERNDAMRAHKIADRLQDKVEICERNERQFRRDFVLPAASILYRLHPSLLGIDDDDDYPERPPDGECVVM